MSACVAIVQYRPLEELPPVMTLLSVLRRMGREVFYVGIESAAGKRFLEENGVAHKFLLKRQKNKILRLLTFLPRRWQLISLLKGLKRKYGAVVPWFQECHSAALAGDGVYRLGRCITTFFEYECNYGERWLGFDLERMMHSNVIVECEINRARMTQKNHNLKQCPFVIPNKVEIDFNKIPPLNDEAKAVFEKIGDRPVFLYQGYVADDRKDLLLILETIAKHRPNYCVLSLPGSDALEKRLAPYPNAFTLKRIPAPGHLAVTAKATVGIAVYNAEGTDIWALNAQYCAPNKIYEYAAFGLPTLGNRIPGLLDTIGAAQAGVLCEMMEQDILKAADELVAHIGQYRFSAQQFYASVDLDGVIKAVLEEAK